MSEAEEHDSVRVSADGVRVLKRFVADQFPVPAIAFEISSGRNKQVTLRLSDLVPQGVAVDDLGFHPDYGSEHWTIEEDRITFERELEAKATYTTVYGIRAADDVGQFLTDPVIESVTPPLSATGSEDDVVLESDDALVEDAISRGIDSTEEDEEPTEKPEVPSTLDLSNPDTDASGGSDASDDDGVTSAGPPAEPTTDEPEQAAEGSVVASLATELRRDNVSQADLDLLREVLVEHHDGPGSRTARLDRLQQDVADLRAYTGAIEEFLDENGTGAELVDSFEAKLDAFDDRLEQLETGFVVEMRGRIEALEEQFEQLESNITEEFDRVDHLEQQTEAAAERADDDLDSEPEERIDDLDSELEERIDDLDSELEERIDNLDSELEERIDNLDSKLEERIDNLETKLERIDDLESELTELKRWREQLVSTAGD